MRNPILILALALSAGALSLGLWSWQQFAQNNATARENASMTATVLPRPRPLPDITLVNQDAEAVDLSAGRGRWSLWFLGFTHCPDVCPNTLSLLASVRQTLASAEPRIDLDMMFVSVDPKRDSADALKTYVSYFDPAMQGLTGTTEAIDTLTSSLYLPYSLDAADENGQYNVEHSGVLVLVGPDAAVHAYFSPPHSARVLVRELRQLVKAR